MRVFFLIHEDNASSSQAEAGAIFRSIVHETAVTRGFVNIYQKDYARS